MWTNSNGNWPESRRLSLTDGWSNSEMADQLMFSSDRLYGRVRLHVRCAHFTCAPPENLLKPDGMLPDRALHTILVSNRQHQIALYTHTHLLSTTDYDPCLHATQLTSCAHFTCAPPENLLQPDGMLPDRALDTILVSNRQHRVALYTHTPPQYNWLPLLNPRHSTHLLRALHVCTARKFTQTWRHASRSCFTYHSRVQPTSRPPVNGLSARSPRSSPSFQDSRHFEHSSCSCAQRPIALRAQKHRHAGQLVQNYTSSQAKGSPWP